MAERRRRVRTFGTVRRLSSGRWQARYYGQAGNRHTAPRTFASKADAAAYLATVEADMRRHTWIAPQLARVTFAEWAERWEQTTAELRPGTRTLYGYLLRRFLLPAFGPMPLGQLDPLSVRIWLAGLHQAGEVTPTTIAKAYRLLRRILNVAVESGYLARNPCQVKGAGVEHAAEMRHLSAGQLTRLATEVPDRYRALVWWLALAGCAGVSWLGCAAATLTPHPLRSM